ncbi:MULTISPECIES: DUF1707 domain-containing protein [unclassified Streptomyces]|uniref:DUF1707 domain-containing protein n=2 Tax=unclassified Streptomyces TaxID=2593676 RepID=A0AAU1UE27_9ACTN|nr:MULTISPECIES: DUF1707 domain-containing protein [unclassified Streptomyces]MCX4645196.1 DUF1707 domain-containing protein [Streptomyces sp. NBC_01446]MCX5326036.1 DUF1707 domain-containing protein [Streptomyces sp. NBC_00120]
MTDERPERPEPNDLPELRASDADRDRVAEALRDALAEGRLDMEEFDERLEAVYAARTYGELAPITRDLPGAGAAAPGTSVSFVKEPQPEGAVDWRARIGGEATSTWALALFGGFGRKGRWTVGERFTAFAMFGGGEIDLREARFASRDVVINCFAIMGGIQIKVPPELDVAVKGFGFMGGVDDRASGEGTPGSPRVVVRGFALMGGVGVDRRVSREERLRLKEERRQDKLDRRTAHRGALEGRHERHAERHHLRHERHEERRERQWERAEERRERREP